MRLGDIYRAVRNYRPYTVKDRIPGDLNDEDKFRRRRDILDNYNEPASMYIHGEYHPEDTSDEHLELRVPETAKQNSFSVMDRSILGTPISLDSTTNGISRDYGDLFLHPFFLKETLGLLESGELDAEHEKLDQSFLDRFRRRKEIVKRLFDGHMWYNWLCLFAMFVVLVMLAVVVPLCLKWGSSRRTKPIISSYEPLSEY